MGQLWNRVGMLASIALLAGGCGQASTPSTSPDAVSDANGDEGDATPTLDSGVQDAADLDSAEATPDGSSDPDASSDPDGSSDPDASPEPPSTPFCDPCTNHAQCGDEKDQCLTNTETGENFCTVDCSTTEGLCPPGGLCLDLGDGLQQCVPPGATCEGHQPISLKGQLCADSALCYGEFGT